MRLKLTLAYDGRPFQGWQSQANGNTIQDHLLRALEIVAKQPIAIYGSGRTDTGVHALAQTAHFDVPPHISMNPYNWVPALNSRLPATIRILSCEESNPDFHARFSAIGKIYHYDLCTLPVLPPFKAGLALHLPKSLDPYVLSSALECFIGRHNFHSFAAYRGNEAPDADWFRTIHHANLTTLDDGYRLTWHGDGFLYKMVRILTGTAIHCAQGRMSLDDLRFYLNQTSNCPQSKSPHCAPADGLFLQQVIYP